MADKRMETNRRQLLQAPIFLSTAAWIGGVSQARADAPKQTTFSIAVSPDSDPHFAVFMADSNGLFKKYNIVMKYVAVGGSRGIQVLLSHEIQAVHVGMAAVMQANSQGAGVALIAGSTKVNPLTLYTRPDVKTAATLKGGRIAISNFGSETDFGARLAIQKLGLTSKDVVISELGSQNTRLAGLLSGRIAGAMLLEPTSTIADERGLFPLVSLSKENVPWVFDGVVVERSYLKSHRPLLTNFLKAYVEAIYLAKAQPKLAKQAIVHWYKLKDEKAIDNTYSDFIRNIPPNAIPDDKALNNVAHMLNGMGVSGTVAQNVDFSILRGLKTNGFIAEMEQRYPSKA